MSVQWPGSKGKPLTFPRETMITENLQEQPELIWWAGKLKSHIEVWEELDFQIKMSLHGHAQGVSWCYQRIQTFYHSWAGSSVCRDWSAYCRWIFLFMLLLFCSSVLQSSCWSDFSRDGLVARARTLHLPSSALLPAALCQLLHLADYQEFRLIENFSWYHQLQIRLSCCTTVL